MLIDKIVTIFVVLIIDFLLFKRYVNGYSRVNLIAVILSICGFSIYLYISVKSADMLWQIQLVLLAFMIIIPAIVLYFLKSNRENKTKNVFDKIQKYMDEKKTYEARKLINKYLEEHEENADILIMLGKCDKIDKDYESALSNFMKAVEMDNKSYIAYYELGTLMELQGKIDTAIVMLTSSNKLKPDFYDAAELLGICYTSERKYDDAQRVYLSALKYHKDSYELNYNLAAIYLERGYIDEAEEYLVNAAKLSNEPYGACYSLGNIYYTRGKYQNALENYKLARLDKTLSASCFYKMALIYCKVREYENADICAKYSILLDHKYLANAKTEISFDKIIDSLLSFDENVAKLKFVKEDEEISDTAFRVASEQDFLNIEKLDIIFR